MFSLLLIVFTVLILDVESAKVDLIKITLNTKYPYLETDCNITLNQNEVMDEVVLKKDGITYLRYNETAKQVKWTFTPIDGISESSVIHSSGCRITFTNYKDSTFGTHELILFYKNVSNPSKPILKRVVSIKKLTWKPVKCVANWIPVNGDQTAMDVFVAATKTTDNALKICRVQHDTTTVPGVCTTAGCTYTWNGAVLNNTSYEILKGTGFIWTSQTGTQNVQDAFEAGTIGAGGYIGRCTKNKVTYLGKVGDKFYYANNNEEKSDCPNHDILTCKK